MILSSLLVSTTFIIAKIDKFTLYFENYSAQNKIYKTDEPYDHKIVITACNFSKLFKNYFVSEKNDSQRKTYI